MSAKSQPEDRRHLPPQDELLNRLGQLDGSLQDRIDQDHRFQSGVPENERPTDLDFILMSGLTRPAPENLLTPADFSRPISFFEEGVVDVDDAMAPATIDSEPVADEVLGAPIAPPGVFHGDSNIIEMPGFTPPAETPEPEQEPVADAADIEPEQAEPSPIPTEDPYELPAATIEDPLEHHPADEAAQPPLEIPPPILESPEEPAGTLPQPEPVALTTPSPEPSFADEVTSSDDEVSLLIDQYLKSARQEPAAIPALEPEPLQTFEEPVSQPEPEPEPIPEPEPEPLIAAAPMMETEAFPPPPQSKTSPAPDLAEAELLLRALENQPHDIPMPPPAETQAPVLAEPDVDLPSEVDLRGEVENLPVRELMTRHGARRSRRSRSRARRRKIRLTITAIAVAVVTATLTGAYLWLRPVFSTPEARVAAAEQLAAGGSYYQASAAFQAFASDYPQHPSRASAEFMAAHFAAMAPARDFDEEQAVAQRALALFEKFLNNNPTHVKAPRAWVMLAQLHYKLGQYKEAVNILRDPVLRLRDPESALPGLRALARSYVRLGEHESAVSAYQQAAALAGNYAPDADYDELGDLFKLRADRADDPGDVQELRQAAVENWNHAIRVPGIDPANKAKVQDKIKWLKSQTGEQQQPPVTPETDAVAEGPPEPALPTAPDAAQTPPAPAVDPAAEAEFLGGSHGTESVQ